MADEASFNPKVQSSGGGDDSGKIRRTAVGSGGGDEFDENIYWLFGGEGSTSKLGWVITLAIESIGHALAEMPKASNYSGLADVGEMHFRKAWSAGEKNVFGDLAPMAIELVVSAFCIIEAGYDDNILKQAFPSFTAQQIMQLKWLVRKYAKEPD